MVGRDESPASVLDGTADAQILLHDKTHWNQRPGVPHCISILWQSSMAVSNVRASSIRRIASSEAVAGHLPDAVNSNPLLARHPVSLALRR